MYKKLEFLGKTKKQCTARKERKAIFLSNEVAKQYPVDKYRKLVFICVDIVQNFLITLEDGFDYNSTSIASYGEKYGSSQRSTKSRVESILIKNMQSQEQMEDFLNSFFIAYNNLNDDEKAIFNLTYFDRFSEEDIMKELLVNSNYVVRARKSATIKFCLKSGLNKFIDVI